MSSLPRRSCRSRRPNGNARGTHWPAAGGGYPRSKAIDDVSGCRRHAAGSCRLAVRCRVGVGGEEPNQGCRQQSGAALPACIAWKAGRQEMRLQVVTAEAEDRRREARRQASIGLGASGWRWPAGVGRSEVLARAEERLRDERGGAAVWTLEHGDRALALNSGDEFGLPGRAAAADGEPGADLLTLRAQVVNDRFDVMVT